MAEYDPGERERRGVYYTPEPVVSHIVRSLNELLKEKFDRNDGLASEGVTLLDPGAGTMTFIAKACQVAVREFEAKYGSGNTQGFIQQHILKNYFAFELMMAPYAVGHLKMSFFLEELGYKLSDEDRFKFYLTNTLEMENLEQTEIPGMASLAQESRLAGEVKKHQPILVILGNPPYSGHSSNKGKEISELIDDYKIVDGKPLGEKNPKWLQDDYVKFIRFAQWKIDQVGHGVIGLITNHSYLDNPTFRGMRQSLMNTFDEIYILDLHGNSLKKEKSPDGSKDENVFDIRAGVAIVFLIRCKEKKPGKVFHSELWGVRKKKYDWLSANQFKTTKWKEIKSQSEQYMFVPRDEKTLKQYNRYLKVTDIFPKNSVGIVTSRDKFVLDFDKEALKQRIRIFRDSKMPDEMVREALNLKDNHDWKMPEKRKKVQADKEWEKKIVKCLYRPFDKRWVIYHPDIIERGREEIMRHMMEENLGLIIPKRVEIFGGWGHALITDKLIEHVAVSLKTIDYLFPLFLFPDKLKSDLFSHLEENSKRTANINSELFDALKNHYRKHPSPEKILYYVYAVLYSNVYRDKYKEFLKSDFPRVPFTGDKILFDSLSKLGKKLADLHLLKGISSPSAKFHGSGDSRVARSKKEFFYDSEARRVHINANQYFDSVPQDVWDYKIGGYQVLSKWLKDRKGRVLTLEEIKDYCRIVTALKQTIEVQSQIDSFYPRIENDVIQMD